MELGAAVGGVGEHQADAETEGVMGGLQGVTRGRDVVHEVGLPERQVLGCALEVMRLGGDGAKGQAVAA